MRIIWELFRKRTVSWSEGRVSVCPFWCGESSVTVLYYADTKWFSIDEVANQYLIQTQGLIHNKTLVIPFYFNRQEPHIPHRFYSFKYFYLIIMKYHTAFKSYNSETFNKINFQRVIIKTTTTFFTGYYWFKERKP